MIRVAALILALMSSLGVPLVVGSGAHAYPMAYSSSERAYISAIRAAVPLLRGESDKSVLAVGQYVCTYYELFGRTPKVTKSLQAFFSRSVSVSQANVMVSAATKHLCP